MKNKSAQYPKYNHTNIEDNPIMGKVKVYKFTKFPRESQSGSQANFYQNGAEINNENQFALKLFDTDIEAFAAFQRQQLAAIENLAPPVGQMVCWDFNLIYKKGSRSFKMWGYETCLADVSKHAKLIASILGSELITGEYLAYCKHNSLHKAFSKRSVNAYWKMVNDNYTNDNHTSEYKFSSHSALSTVQDQNSVRYKLGNINLLNTQYDDLSSARDMGMEWDSRLVLGEKWVSDDGAAMLNDLHIDNIGLWKNKAVVIDFGYHICCPFYINHDDLICNLDD